MHDQRTEFILNRISGSPVPPSSEVRNHKIRAKIETPGQIGAFPLDAICEESDLLIRGITHLIESLTLQTAPAKHVYGAALGPTRDEELGEETTRLEVSIVNQ